MSILSALLPLALSVSPQALAAPVTLAPEPVALPVATAPAAKPVEVKFAPPAAKPAIKPAPAVARPGEAELIKIQGSVAMDRNAIIDRVAKAMTDTKTVQGRFTQVDPAGSPSSGAFYINRPGKVRFEYTSPEPIFIVSDGATVSIEEPKRKAYDAIPLASTPLHLFLRSNIDLKKDGSVTDVSTSNGSHFVTLMDKTGEAEGKMILQFRATDFELLGWRQIDGTGAETRVQLADMKKNVSLKPSLFVVKDPNDVNDERR
ncbi:MAG: outer-membrane lipoprotein carrier protein LolA [Hyphomonadaceae bacterium]|nr:outer-membrane lipoprotein carrier protein LolA [Hyphomonadaceae bacterium]